MKKYIGIIGLFTTLILTGCGSEVKLGEYKGIEAEKVVCTITDEDVQDAIDEMLDEYVTYDEIKDRAAQDGDYVNVDYVLKKLDGKDYNPSDEDGEDLYSAYGDEITIGDEYVYPEVEKALVGMKSGDKKTVTGVFTEDYVDGDMVGKKTEFEVTLNSILEENVPEFNDAFVKENLGFDTIDEYKESLKGQLLSDKEDEYKYESVAQILQTIIDNSTFNGYDQKMYKECEDEYDANNQEMASMFGMELSDYEEMMGLDADGKKDEIIGMVRERQVIEAIAKAENITVSDDDANKFAQDSYADYSYESANAFIKDYGLDYLKKYLLSKKVHDFLYDNAVLTEISEEEYNNRNAGDEESDEDIEDGEEISTDDESDSDSEEISTDDQE